MHILVVNDDGPPSPAESPYVLSFVRELEALGHVVSVCLPSQQRSWIGKSHFARQTMTAVPYSPPAAASRPDHGCPPSWRLVNGTPATAVQLGVHHLFRHCGPVDLVLSGPNFGGNLSTVLGLSSGTLGGALEAASMGVPAIAVSFCFRYLPPDMRFRPDAIAAACRRACLVAAALVRDWPFDNSVDLYNVNVPITVDAHRYPAVFMPMLQNKWSSSLYVPVAANDSPPASSLAHPDEQTVQFQWAPRFDQVFQSVSAGDSDTTPTNDGAALSMCYTSITPLKACYQHAASQSYGTELRL